MSSEIENVQELANIHIDKSTVSLDDIEKHVKASIRTSFNDKFPNEVFEKCWDNYTAISPFCALGNIYDTDQSIDAPTHFIIRLVSAWYIAQALKAMKFDIDNDPNMLSDDGSNIGTAGRIAKIWAGNGLDSENIREYGDGRWTEPPRLAVFPAKDKDNRKPVTIVIDQPGIGSVCSHHFLPYSVQNTENSKIIISYLPKQKLLGLSKIGRFVEWCLNRPSLQEEVTELIHKKIVEIAGTDDVYVGLINLSHTCEVTRGAKQYSTTTTEDYSGIFNSDEVRNSITVHT